MVDSQLKHIPGIHPENFLTYYSVRANFIANSIQFIERNFERFGDLFAMSIPIRSPYPNSPGVVFVRGDHHVKTVLKNNDDFEAFPLAGSLYPLDITDVPQQNFADLFGGWFKYNGHDHANLRKTLIPAFARANYEYLKQTIQSHTMCFVHTALKQDKVSIFKCMEALSQSILGEFILGDFAQRDVISQLVKRLRYLMIAPVIYTTPLMRGSRHLMMASRVKRAKSLILDALDHARQSNTRSFIKYLADLPSLDDRDISGLVFTTFMAGYETVANTLAWTFFLLSQHPDTYWQLYTDRDAHLQNILYESMRVLPTVSFNPRIIQKETYLDRYRLPTHTEIIVSLMHTHYAPEIYPEPRAFQPSRWDTIQAKAMHFLPFSYGPRLCPGRNLGLFMMMDILDIVNQHVFFALPVRTRVNYRYRLTLLPPKNLQLHADSWQNFHQARFPYATGNINDLIKIPKIFKT